MIDQTHMIEISHKIDNSIPFLSLNSPFMQISHMIKNNKFITKKAIRYIAKDPLMTALVMGFAANSTQPNKITTLKKAIEIIGETSIVKVFNQKIINEAFSDSKKEEEEKLWLHNLGVAIIAKTICENTIYAKQSEELYFAGLLHDLGIYVIRKYFKEDYSVIKDIVNNDPNKRLLLAEKKVLGVTHQEIGVFFAKKHNLSKSLINVIRHHHYVDSGMEEKHKIAIVMIANNLAKGLKFGGNDNIYLEPIPDSVWRFLQLDQSNYYQIISDIQDKFDISTAFTK